MEIIGDKVRFTLTASFCDFIMRLIVLCRSAKVTGGDPWALNLNALGLLYVGMLYSNDNNKFEMPLDELPETLEKECGVPLYEFDETEKITLKSLAEQWGFEPME